MTKSWCKYAPDIRSVCYCFGLQETLKCAHRMPSISESMINFYIASYRIDSYRMWFEWLNLSRIPSPPFYYTLPILHGNTHYSAELFSFKTVQWEWMYFICTRFESFVTGVEFQWNKFYCIFCLVHTLFISIQLIPIYVYYTVASYKLQTVLVFPLRRLHLFGFFLRWNRKKKNWPVPPKK